MLGVKAKKDILDRYNDLAMNYSDETADEMTKLQDEIESRIYGISTARSIRHGGAGLPAGRRRRDQAFRRRTPPRGACRLLLEQPELLLLDEPTNHLDAETVNWLEGHLRAYPGAILIVTHDRYFLDNVTGWILELDRGKGIPYEGNYTNWLKQKQKRLALESSEDRPASARWRRKRVDCRLPKARQAKSKARIQRYEELVAKSAEKAPTTAQIIIPIAERLGDNVIDFEHLSKAYGDTLLIDDLSFKLPLAACRVIAPTAPADHIVSHDHRTGEARQRQDHHRRERAARLCRPVARRARRQEDRLGGNFGRQRSDLSGQARDQLPRLLLQLQFQGLRPAEEGRQPLGRERNRVHLAKMLKSGANVLLLDEPTNDLDVDTLRALEEALVDFAGCAVVISHDRFFLDRIATHMLAYEGDSHVEWFEGNFADYEEDKKRRLGIDSIVPHRLKYKKFSR